jgi:hypothetical protein
MSLESVRCSCGVALESRLGHAYNEEAFRHFLAVERKRGDRSRRSVLLLLINMKKQPGMSGRIPPVVAARIFSGLWHGVREVDFVGWFREDRVTGAVLTQGAVPLAPDVPRRIAHRITEILSERVPASVARRLHVRVLQLRPAQRS